MAEGCSYTLKHEGAVATWQIFCCPVSELRTGIEGWRKGKERNGKKGGRGKKERGDFSTGSSFC